MTTDIISTVIISLFLLILLAGFLFGLGRGFNKSLVRLLIVVAMLVATFFIVPIITEAVMTIDISGMGINISGKAATSVGNIVVLLLESIPGISDIAGTDAYATIINVVPQMILNIVLFVVVFLLLRFISMIIYWIISGICFSKKKTEGKNKHRLLGSLVGVVQNFIIFLAILVPVVGVVNILGEVEATVNQPETTLTAVQVSDSGTDETPSGEGSGDEQVPATVNIQDIVEEYNSTWVAKFLQAVKLDQACQFVFDDLTTIKEGDVEYNLKEETLSVSVVAKDVMELLDLGELDFSNPQTIILLQKIVNHSYEGKLSANLIDEIVPIAVSKWVNDETFFGIALPTVDGVDSSVIKTLLTSVAASDSIKDALISTTNLVSSLMNTAQDIVAENGDINLDKVGDLLNELTQDESTMNIAKDIVQSNLDSILDSVLPTPEDPADTTTQTYKDMISETIDSIFSAEYETTEQKQNEIEVITESLKIADKLANYDPADATTNIDQTDATAIIEKLDNSTVILNTLKSNDSAISETIQDAIASNTDAQSYITEAIKGLTNDTNKEDLCNIFGIDPSTVLTPPAA